MRGVFNIARNAAAPIEQIERIYAHHLPISAATAINLLTFCAAKLQGPLHLKTIYSITTHTC